MIFSVCYAIVVSLLVIGIALAIAGVIIIIITILDRSQIIGVTQFNDTGYLIYWI